MAEHKGFKSRKDYFAERFVRGYKNDLFSYELAHEKLTSTGTTKLTAFEGSASSGNQINVFAGGFFTAISSMIYRQHCLNRHCLDEPATIAATTYKIQGANPYTAGGTGNVFVNRSSNDTNSSFVQNPQSELVLMEIAE